MRDAQKNYLLVGVFVLAMLAALVAWLTVLAGHTGATDSYYIAYDNVMGLSEGAQILYEGYPVGLIEEIAPTASRGGGFRLDVGVRKGWKIPEDSIAQITQSGLLSAVVIDIQAGRSNRVLKPGSRIPSREATNVFSTIASVATDLGELADNSLKPLLDNLTEGTSSLTTLSKDAPIIIENLKAFTIEISEASHRLNLLVANSTGHVDRTLVNLESASENVAKLSGDFDRTRARLDSLVASVRSLVTDNKDDIHHAIGDLHHSLEVVARHVDEISHNLEATTRNMNEFSAQIRRNPALIIRGRSFDEDPALVQ